MKFLPGNFTRVQFPGQGHDPTSPWSGSQHHGVLLVERKLPRKPELAKPELAESDDMPNSGRDDNTMAPEDPVISRQRGPIVACRVVGSWGS